MSLPNEARTGKRLSRNGGESIWPLLSGLSADEFRAAAEVLLCNGHHPLPLGRVATEGKDGRKVPWFRGLFGRDGVDATPDQVDSWPARIEACLRDGASGSLQIGARMPVGGIGLDVDAYDGKRGLSTLAEHEARLGPLPMTWRVTARAFGGGSGIRLFRVPEGWVGKAALKSDDGSDGHIETIQRHLRLMVVPPSYHRTGARYKVYDEHSGNEVLGGVIPPVAEWPELPDAWLDGLRVDAAKAVSGEATDEQEDEFSATHTRSDQPWHLAEYILPSVRKTEGSTRNAAFKALHEAARTARVGWCLWAAAVDQIELAARESYAERDEAFDSADFARSVKAAVRAACAENLPELEARYAKRLANEEANRLAVAGIEEWAPTMVNDQSDAGPVTRSLADVEPTKVEWLWRPWLPLGKVSILEGEPDVGKSALSLTLTAIVSNGGAWPDSIVGGDVVRGVVAEAAGVVLVGVEDDYADTVVPRLIAANADLARVHTIVQPLDARGNPEPFVVPDDVERLQRAVVETRARLVIIDPITAFLSTKQVKAGDDSSTRQALMPLVVLAAETGCAVVLVRHLNKATGMSAKHRGSGTIAFTGVTRSVLIAGTLKEQTPDGPTHAIARTKGNLSREPMAIGYRLDSAPDDPDSPVVTWCGPIDMNADQLVGADGAKVGDARKSAPARQEAMEILLQLLSEGPVSAETAIKLTKENAACGIKTVKEATKQLGVIKKRVYVDGKVDHWTWELPPEKFRLTDNVSGGELDLDDPGP